MIRRIKKTLKENFWVGLEFKLHTMLYYKWNLIQLHGKKLNNSSENSFF